MRRFKFPVELDYRYRVLNPSGRMKSFRVAKFKGETYLSAVESKALEAINSQFQSDTLSKTEARAQVDELVERLYKADGVLVERVVHNKANQKLLESYLEAQYVNGSREVINIENSAGYFRRAVDALGELTLMSATRKELSGAINAAYTDNRQRRIAASLNSILSWLGRGDARIPIRKKRRFPIQHIGLDELEPALANVVITAESCPGLDPKMSEEGFRVLCRLAIFSGLRIGEIMALEPKDKTTAFINVNWQIDRMGEKREPKFGKTRRVAPFPEAMGHFDEWMKFKMYVTPQIRKRASRILKTACQKTWKSKKEWHLRFHDLRHSYAIACLEAGMQLERVARNLGNSNAVCEDHYTGHFHTDITVEQDFALLQKRKQS